MALEDLDDGIDVRRFVAIGLGHVLAAATLAVHFVTERWERALEPAHADAANAGV